MKINISSRTISAIADAFAAEGANFHRGAETTEADARYFRWMAVLGGELAWRNDHRDELGRIELSPRELQAVIRELDCGYLIGTEAAK